MDTQNETSSLGFISSNVIHLQEKKKIVIKAFLYRQRREIGQTLASGLAYLIVKCILCISFLSIRNKEI